MKAYLLALGAGLLVGVVYSLLGVRSPAPPVIALVGLGGILLGEQLIPVAKRLSSLPELTHFVRHDCANHVLGRMPADNERNA